MSAGGVLCSRPWKASIPLRRDLMTSCRHDVCFLRKILSTAFFFFVLQAFSKRPLQSAWHAIEISKSRYLDVSLLTPLFAVNTLGECIAANEVSSICREADQAHRECSVNIRRSKCAARVCETNIELLRPDIIRRHTSAYDISHSFPIFQCHHTLV